MTKWSFTARQANAIFCAKEILTAANIKECRECQEIVFGSNNINVKRINQRAMDFFERGYLRSTTFIFRRLSQICF